MLFVNPRIFLNVLNVLLKILRMTMRYSEPARVCPAFFLTCLKSSILCYNFLGPLFCSAMFCEKGVNNHDSNYIRARNTFADCP